MFSNYFYEPMQKVDIESLKKISTLKDYIVYISNRFGNQKALVYKEDNDTKSITYKELFTKTTSMGHELVKDMQKGAPIAILAEPGPEWIIAFLSITAFGGTAVALPQMAPPQAIQGMLMMSRAKGILYGSGYEGTAKDSEEKLGLPICRKISELINGSADNIIKNNDVTVTPDMNAVILFTSGTTGLNKAVPLTHFNVMSNAYNGMLGMPFHNGERCLIAIPLFHVFGLIRSTLSILYEGGEVYINENMKTFFPNLKWAKPTTLVLVPAMAEALLSYIKKAGTDTAGGSLKTIITGGAAMKPKTKEGFLEYRINLLQGYGLTEGAMISGNVNVDSHFDSVGKIYPGNEIKQVDGELWLKGDSVFNGYLDPSMNEEVIEDGWFKTGDLGHIDNDGYIYITGRKKFIIITDNGENISPEELENLVNGISQVEESMSYEAVSPAGNTVIGIEIYAPGIEYEVLREQVNSINKTLPIYKQMQVIVKRDEPFPKSASNKIIRKLKA